MLEYAGSLVQFPFLMYKLDSYGMAHCCAKQADPIIGSSSSLTSMTDGSLLCFSCYYRIPNLFLPQNVVNKQMLIKYTYT